VPGTGEQPLRLTGGREKIRNISFILATGWDGPSPFPPFYEKAKAKRWKTRTVPCGHDVMLDLPDVLTTLLVEATRVASTNSQTTNLAAH
jgi:hypothetical protein